MKWVQPIAQTCTSHLTSVASHALCELGGVYYYAVLDGSHYDIYKATSFLVADETLIGTLTSTLATPSGSNIMLYNFNNTVIYVVASFIDAAIAAGGNDYQYKSAKYTIATTTWAAIGTATIASGCTMAEGRFIGVVGQWSTIAGNHYIVTWHFRKAAGNFYYRTTCYSSTFAASSTLDSAAGEIAYSIGGKWDETAAKYYWLYYKGGVWIFKYATTAPTIDNDDPSIIEPTMAGGVVQSDKYTYAIMANGSRIVLSSKDHAYYDINVGSWIEETRATDNYNCLALSDDEPYYLIWNTGYYYRIGNEWHKIWNNFTAAHNKMACILDIMIVNSVVYKQTITADIAIRSAPLTEGLFEIPQLSLQFTSSFVPFSHQSIFVFNDNDEWMGIYTIAGDETTGGYRSASGSHILLKDLTTPIATTITAKTIDEHITDLLAFCEVLQAGSLNAYATHRTLSYNTDFTHTLILLCAFEKAIAYWTVEGELVLDDATTDSGIDLVFGTTPILSVVKSAAYQKPRYVTVNGGYVDGVQISYTFPLYASGSPVIFNFTAITDPTYIEELAEHLAELLDVDAIFYTVTYQGAIKLQPGTTITLTYPPKSIDGQFIVMNVKYNLYTNINEVVVCSHLIYPVVKWLATDVDQYVSALQCDVNNPAGPIQTHVGTADAIRTAAEALAACVETEAYAADWDGETKAPSKNAVYDAMPHIRMLITDPADSVYYGHAALTKYCTMDLDAQTSTEEDADFVQDSEHWNLYEACPTWATWVYCRIRVYASTASSGNYVLCRNADDANIMGGLICFTQAANYWNACIGWVEMNASKQIRLKVVRVAGTVTVEFTILGWGYFPAV